MRKLKLFIILVVGFLAVQVQAFTPAEMARQYRNCVRYVRLPVSQRRADARRLGIPYSTLLNACNYTLRTGLKRSIELENEYQRWLHGPHDSGGAIFPGSLGCLSNEYYVDGSCEPKSLVRCIGGADCAFGESCTAGVCH